MADVKWIKITTDMFDNAKIKYLRSLPEGNNIVLIWVMLLTKAGICNAGGMIFLAENIPYTTAMLANELGFGEDTVRLAITMLSKLGMVHAEDVLTITNWDVYQNSEGLEKVREQTRARVAKRREKHKAIGCNVTSNATVTLSNATDIEIDIDKDIEKERTDTKVSARKKFVPPTVDEVNKHIEEKGYHFDAEAFIAFYESNGWMVGKNKMKSWKAACVTWEQKYKKPTNKPGNGRDDVTFAIIDSWGDDK